MSDIKDWSTVAASNNDSPPDGFPEGMAPSTVNNAAREVMASVRVYYDEPEWRDWGHTITYGSATTFTSAAGDGDTTAIYHENRRVRAVGSLTGTIYGYISGSVHTSQTTVTVVWDSGSLSNEALIISIGFAADTISTAEQSVSLDPDIVKLVSTTAMTYYQAAAPTDWTQNVAHNDKVLRVVSGSGGGSGGTHGVTAAPSTSHTHTGPSHTHTGPSHTHTVGSHRHQWYDYRNSLTDRSFNSGGGAVNLSSSNDGSFGIDGNATGSTLDADYYTANSSGSTGAAGTGATGAAGTGATGSSAPTAFAPLYIDMIICTKD